MTRRRTGPPTLPASRTPRPHDTRRLVCEPGRSYLERLYANGTAQLANAVAIQPYSFPWLPMDSPPQLVGGFNDLPTLHELMVRHGDAGKTPAATTGTDRRTDRSLVSR